MEVRFWTTLILTLLQHCSGEYEILSKEDLVVAVAQANNFFAFDFFKTLNNRDNNLISPWSLSTSFAMLYLGAKEETAKEMEKVLYRNEMGLKGEFIHKGFKLINEWLDKDDENYTLNSVNSILIQDGMDISHDYLPILRKIYGATVYDIDFTAGNHDRLLKFINALTELRTRGKFTEILDSPPSRDTRLILLNTIYFKGIWKNMFDPKDTADLPFYNYGRTPIKAPFMRMVCNVSVGYDKLTDLRVLELPYTMGDLSILFLMPAQTNDLNYLDNVLTAEVLDRIVSDMGHYVYEIGLLKFSLKKSYQPKPNLMELGLRKIFSMAEADLTGISETEGLYLSKVIHQVSIDINEEGTEATGSTAAVLDSRTSPPKFYLNRPFQFLIRDRRTKVILFVGRINYV